MKKILIIACILTFLLIFILLFYVLKSEKYETITENNADEQVVDSNEKNTQDIDIEIENNENVVVTLKATLEPTKTSSINQFDEMYKKTCYDDTEYYNWEGDERIYNYLVCDETKCTELFLFKASKNTSRFQDYELARYQNAETCRICMSYFSDKYFYYYYKNDEGPFLNAATTIMQLTSGYSGRKDFETPMDLIERYPNRKILAGVDNNDQLLGQYFLSCIFHTFLRVKDYVVDRGIIIDEVLFYIRWEISKIYYYITDEETHKRTDLFFKYVFKEIELPNIKKDEKYENGKKFVLEDSNLAICNNISISIRDHINTIPKDLIVHIYDCMYFSCFIKFN
ncbi:hypothetical protein NGRA_1665 [Nosema granulosis]|uniref:Uncharacterized protein n=1 Tax=Nosema granulosis TaxID=83296 RepID=A0A9P6H0S6_9MICR|nr:hypothetical protein NGRA_1665 [Nosema granulosis]